MSNTFIIKWFKLSPVDGVRVSVFLPGPVVDLSFQFEISIYL